MTCKDSEEDLIFINPFAIDEISTLRVFMLGYLATNF